MLDCLLYYPAVRLDLPSRALRQANTSLFRDDQADPASALIFSVQRASSALSAALVQEGNFPLEASQNLLFPIQSLPDRSMDS